MKFTYNSTAGNQRYGQGASKALIGAAVAGFLLFLVIQVIIPFLSSSNTEQLTPMLTKDEAIRRAEVAYTSAIFSATPSFSNTSKGSSIPSSAQFKKGAIYYTNDLLSGYLSKYELHTAYNRWEKAAPYDIYRVFFDKEAPLQHKRELVTIDIHMRTGQIVGYQQVLSDTIDADNSSTTSEVEQPNPDRAYMLAHSDEAVLQLGYTPAQLARKSEQLSNEIRYTVKNGQVGDAKLEVVVWWQNGKISQAQSIWTLPEAYTQLMQEQKSTAEQISSIGYVLMSVIFAAAACIMALIYRKRIRFRSRTMLTLAALSCLISILHGWNVIPGTIMADRLEPIGYDRLQMTITIQSLFLFVQAGITLYLALIVGRSCWDVSQHKQVVISWSDADFGRQLVRSFWVGLAFTGVLLGTQSIIYTGLELGMKAWSSTDASSSPLNLSYMFLYPLVAWVAAISEEGFFRLFAVGLFRKFLRNTWVAAIIPTFVWAAGHVTYPIYPYYSRPLELMIIGFLFVWIMVRYGFWSAVVAHLMLDTILMVIPYWIDGSWSGIVIGTFYLLLPMAVVYGINTLHRHKTLKIRPSHEPVS
ncbi:CPBP family intramembrane metalloprotease [Paenibacillus sp. ACRRX]|uniref:CPBP family intramembrane glutamic endopeptidase n=1 Tax=Paenibacillus sp. ACRRX TaxID=2918206 RepID=UPI001EF66537|nr:CPBP family intramembrane glutamic endopeptidase [Paenibacillus sp. ACRRX]MCG7410528.1 CPBP family intramembrane metalloprotease [Paenibacillus sp. ACRRX]